MKKNIKLFALLTLLVAASTSFFIFAKKPADNKPETVVMCFYYSGDASKLWVDYGGGKIEETAMPYVTGIPKTEEQHSKILSMIQKLNAEGYKLVSTTIGGTVIEEWYFALK